MRTSVVVRSEDSPRDLCMNPNARRTVLAGAWASAAMLGLMLASGLDAGQAAAQGTAGKPKSKGKGPVAALTANPTIVAAARRCGQVGNICLKHCIRLTAAGDTSLTACMASVRAMLPVCAALVQLAGLNAARLKDLAKVCSDICADCESECRKHEFHHVECKTCAEACATLVKELKPLLG